MARSSDIGPPPFVRIGHPFPLLMTRLPSGEIIAFETACPHQGQPLSTGTLDGDRIECSHHWYAYDCRTGGNVFPGEGQDLSLQVYEVEESDGWVWLGPVREFQPSND